VAAAFAPQALRRAETLMSDIADPAVALLAELVSINSVNPSLVPGAPGEGQIADAIATHLRRVGMDVEIQVVAPNRPNVIGILEGRAAGPSLMFCGHTDTVGVDGMSQPFTPIVRDGRLYGRGAQDMKSGVAAMIDAARLVAAEGLPAGRLIVAAVIDEEYESLGADAVAARWPADAAVVTEPTDLQIAIAHKGFAWFEVETKGVAAHGSRPSEGRDAILRMGRVLAGLEALNVDLQRRPPHPLMGAPSLHASLIDGGRELSSYPDRCTLRYERRTVGGETDGSVEQELVRLLDDLRARDPEFVGSSRRLFSRPSYEIDASHRLPQTLRRAAARGGNSAPLTSMTFWTDAAVLAAAGTPSVLFGPGGAGLHSVEEYVRIADVLACRDTLVALVRDWSWSARQGT